MRVMFIVLLSLFATSLRAQESEQPAQPQLHPAIKLGMRVNIVKQRWPVAPALVVTRSAEAFLDALNLWTQRVRFPILYDDGSVQAGEHIARFHRAFEPTETFLYEGDKNDDQGFSVERIDALIARIWSNATTTDRNEAWQNTNFKPPGIIILTHDELSLAAATLAVGHGQILITIKKRPGRRGDLMQPQHVEALADEISRALEGSGYTWQSLGDDIDAITLAINSQTRYRDQHRIILAISDRIGTGPAPNDRHAWTSLLQGSSSHSVYQAMSSLFLYPRDVWLYNSYSTAIASNQYAVTPAANVFDAAGFTTATIDAPDGNSHNWYRATRRARNESLFFINTAGHASWFQPGGNRLAANALPLLDKPAAIHFIHSYSAQLPHDTRSILGQWERRGSFAYFGSCDEPSLAAFHTPLEVTKRLLAGMPWAVAPRKAASRIWKLNTFGDPLFTLGKPPVTADIPPFFAQDSFLELSNTLGAALERRDFDTAATSMRWLNRDDEILRLARSILQDESLDMSPRFAQLALHTAAHLGKPELVPQLFRACESLARKDPFLEDLLWHGLRSTFFTLKDQTTLALLQAHIRPESYARDAHDLLPIVKRTQGNTAAQRYTRRLLDNVPDDFQRRQFEKLQKRK